MAACLPACLQKDDSAIDQSGHSDQKVCTCTTHTLSCVVRRGEARWLIDSRWLLPATPFPPPPTERDGVCSRQGGVLGGGVLHAVFMPVQAR